MLVCATESVVANGAERWTSIAIVAWTGAAYQAISLTYCIAASNKTSIAVVIEACSMSIEQLCATVSSSCAGAADRSLSDEKNMTQGYSRGGQTVEM
jgi:hypothetical protein